jgi:DNA-binding NarL/FixJ family response regulator
MHTDSNHVTEAEWQSVVNEIRTLRETFSRLLSLSDSLRKILEVRKIEKRLLLERHRRILEMSEAGTPVRDIAEFVDITAAPVVGIVERMGRMVKRHQNN